MDLDALADAATSKLDDALFHVRAIAMSDPKRALEVLRHMCGEAGALAGSILDRKARMEESQ